ncbi:MAG: MerC domain-containing protein [Bacteroidota bacterium]
MNKNLAILLDKLGICASILCMLHCVALPALLIIGGDSILRVLHQEWLEILILSLSLVIGLLAFIPGYLAHRQHALPLLFVGGFALIIVSHTLFHHGWFSVVLTVIGALAIATAHLLNLRAKNSLAFKEVSD